MSYRSQVDSGQVHGERGLFVQCRCPASLGQQTVDDATTDIGQTIVATLEPIR